jgi:hypothetical protein
MKQILLVLMMIGFTACSGLPVKRGGSTSIDRTERCVLRLVENNGISASEAEKVCSRIFRRNYDTIGIKR